MAAGDFEASFTFSANGAGDFYILARLDGDRGTLWVDSISVCPVDAVILDACRLTLPEAQRLE